MLAPPAVVVHICCKECLHFCSAVTPYYPSRPMDFRATLVTADDAGLKWASAFRMGSLPKPEATWAKMTCSSSLHA
eukprot:713453-Pelagomonas_calceolata.AAC.1